MYENESINDYIRSILGYPNVIPQNLYMDNYNIPPSNMYMQENMVNITLREEIEEYYPEIYKIVYPMVVRGCSKVKDQVTKDIIDRLTEEIYNAVENSNNPITLNINLENEAGQNRNIPQTNSTINTLQKNIKSNEDRGENRQIARNRDLNDLIRILIIRELLGKPGFRPRPPFPGQRKTTNVQTST